VSGDNNASPIFYQVFDRGQRGPDATIIPNDALFNRDIEIAPKKNSLSCNIKGLKRSKTH